MKRWLFGILIWWLPLAAFALPHQFVWDTYPCADCTMNLSCAIGTNVKQPVGSAPAANNTTGINFSLNDQIGDTFFCLYWAQKGVVQSPLGAEVSLTNPLPAPVGRLIR